MEAKKFDLAAFRCSICDSTGQWANVDEHRIKPAGMHLCTVCGFITYPERCSNTEELAEHYRGHEYREAPTVNNLFAGERKVHYHKAFLKELFESWAAEKKTAPRILEIGAALGMVLHWCRKVFPKAELTGTELTLTMRRNAWWLYNVKLDEQADLAVPRDLIISYKVAEHIPEIDKIMRQYALALAPGGKLYVSVPTWFDELQNPGMHGFDLGFYYDPNHVNVWSRNLFEQLLKKSGLKIVKENHVYYGATYLCERDDSLMSAPRTFDDPVGRVEELKRVKQAGILALEGKWQEAVDIWPNFPEAVMNANEQLRSKMHQTGFEIFAQEHLLPAMEKCPNSAHVVSHVADWHMRYEQFEPALGYLKRALEMRPNDPPALSAIATCFRHLAVRAQDPAVAQKYYAEAREVMLFLQKCSKQSEHEAITWQMQDNARLVMPHEVDSPAATT